MVASSLWAAILQTAAVYVLPDAFQDNALDGIYDAFVFVQNGLGYAPVAIFLFAAAHSMRATIPRRLGSRPSATCGFGAAIATLSIFIPYGPMAPGGPGPGFSALCRPRSG